jgi:hypothetical protein
MRVWNMVLLAALLALLLFAFPRREGDPVARHEAMPEGRNTPAQN